MPTACFVATVNHAGAGDRTLPIVWVGDFNSDAHGTVITGAPSATATYRSIIAAGYGDAWSARHPSDVEKASLVGDEAADRLPSGLWPSDYAGVVVILELENGG